MIMAGGQRHDTATSGARGASSRSSNAGYGERPALQHASPCPTGPPPAPPRLLLEAPDHQVPLQPLAELPQVAGAPAAGSGARAAASWDQPCSAGENIPGRTSQVCSYNRSRLRPLAPEIVAPNDAWPREVRRPAVAVSHAILVEAAKQPGAQHVNLHRWQRGRRGGGRGRGGGGCI